MALTALEVQYAAWKGKNRMILDDDGLYLAVYRSQKSWVFRTDKGRKIYKTTIGKYPAMSLSEARVKAAELRLIRDGGDNMRDSMREQRKVTFGEITAEWLKKMKNIWSEGHCIAVESRIKNHLLPVLAERPIKSIKAPELLKILKPLENDGRGETAMRCKQIFGQIARYALANGLCELDISQSLRGAIIPPKHKNFAAITTEGEAAELITAIMNYRGSPIMRGAMLFNLYTLARPGEVRLAEWREISTDGTEWRIPAEKMKSRKPHVVPLSEQAQKLLKELGAITGRGKYIFPSPRNPKEDKPFTKSGVTQALEIMGFKGRMTAHGFRSLGSTILNDLGYRPDVIEAALAHTQQGVRGVYNRGDYWTDRVKLMQEWCNKVDEIASAAESGEGI